jgi:predicted aldo/keto reductase-like oxidoreductase
MLFRNMKKTGDELSILGFGCMRLPQKIGKPGSGEIDEKRAAKLICLAIDHGVNYLDTAMTYHSGKCESFLGRALTDGYRNKVKLATKLPVWAVKNSGDMDLILNVQLDRLKTDHIDYYLLHALEAKSWKKVKEFEICKFLDKAKAEGRIVNAGFSFHGDIETFKSIVDFYDWVFCQIQYNFLDEQNQAGTEGLKYAALRNLGVIIMEPLRGGNLARKVPLDVQAIWDQADTKRTPVEWALRWVWNHPEVTVVLSGMNNEDHIIENLSIANEAYPESLTEEELQTVREVVRMYRKLIKADCTGCRYCLPCPSGIDIPTYFEAYNNLHMFGTTFSAKIFYLAQLTGVGSGHAYASLCQNCGKCEQACPQNLPIRKLFQDVAKKFEKPYLKLIVSITKGILDAQELRLASNANP